MNLGIQSQLSIRSLTAKKTANLTDTGVLRRTIVESEGARSNRSGLLWTLVDGCPAVFKTVGSMFASRASSMYVWPLALVRRSNDRPSQTRAVACSTSCSNPPEKRFTSGRSGWFR
jgi:hypothetical protein